MEVKVRLDYTSGMDYELLSGSNGQKERMGYNYAVRAFGCGGRQA